MIASVTYKLTDLWIKSFTKIKVLGPVPVGSEAYTRVLAFRAQQNLSRAPYLEEKYQLDIEAGLQIDERSHHFALEKEGAIVACVRLTPMPFEFSALSEEFADRALKFHDYFEFGRLCTDTKLERKGFHAAILVVKAAQHLFMKEKAKGVVGICKASLVSYMQKLGMNVDPRPVTLSARKNNYHLLHATKDELLSFYFNRFFGIFMAKPKSVTSPLLNSNSLEKSHDSRPSEKPSRSRIWKTG